MAVTERGRWANASVTEDGRRVIGSITEDGEKVTGVVTPTTTIIVIGKTTTVDGSGNVVDDPDVTVDGFSVGSVIRFAGQTIILIVVPEPGPEPLWDKLNRAHQNPGHWDDVLQGRVLRWPG